MWIDGVALHDIDYETGINFSYGKIIDSGRKISQGKLEIFILFIIFYLFILKMSMNSEMEKKRLFKTEKRKKK